MHPILAGIETEYGLVIEGRGADTQVQDAGDLLRLYKSDGFRGWNYRYESPRQDLRGFSVDHLAVDPEDVKFSVASPQPRDADVRYDHVLASGARLYNDHGHPEFSTMECFGLQELVHQDLSGEDHVFKAAQQFASSLGREVKVYKNNTDFHGASYGTHENYLVPRSFNFEQIYAALAPLLVARQIVTGAGKAGADADGPTPYQISQRADFFMEAANLETLFRRPIFNTRDEPHADPREWIRLHVISCDANRMPDCTARRVGLVKIALGLMLAGVNHGLDLKDPVTAMKSISRDTSYAFRWPGSNLTASSILARYCDLAEEHLLPDSDIEWTIRDTRLCLELLESNWVAFSRKVDWAAKCRLLEMVAEEERFPWGDRRLQSYDLAYHLVDQDESLFDAWQGMGEVAHEPPPISQNTFSRGDVRGYAVEHFTQHIETVCWRSVTFRIGDYLTECELQPNVIYPESIFKITDVESFIEALKNI